jgi:FO synthase
VRSSHRNGSAPGSEDRRLGRVRGRVTFSRNVTLSLSRTCVSHCKYCAFATHQPHLHEPDEVIALLDGASKRRVKELLVLTGDDPAYHLGVRAKLAALGFEDFVAYVVWCCERALERGILPHANLGALPRADLARLREVTASQGLMLESLRTDLVAHQASPTKDRALRLQTIRDAEDLRIPFTSGILVGIGESPADRVAALEALSGFEHLQEVILQNFVPHRRYYGEEPAEVATEAAEEYWRTGVHDGPVVGAPDWATSVTIEDMRELVAATRELMPGVGIQIPPNLADWWPQLVDAGATDLGGLSSDGDHISREHAFPSPHQVQDARGRRPPSRRAVVRVPAVHRSGVAGPGCPGCHQTNYWSFIPRSGSARREDRAIR